MAVTLTATGIRQDVVARLLAANVAGGAGHVFDSQIIDVEAAPLPAVSVVSDDPIIERPADNAMFYTRTEKCGVYGLCTAASDAALAQALDDLEDAIEAALLGDAEWAGSFADMEIAVQKSLNVSSRRRVGGVAVTLTTKYTVQYPMAAGLLDGLERIAVTTEPIQPDGADVSTRLIEVTPP